MVMLFDVYNLPNDIYEIIFATEQQIIVAKLLIEQMKENDGVMDKTTMSLFATRLHDGFTTRINREPYHGKEVKISYNKRQFYDRILTPMKSMGLIQYDLYKKTYRISEKFKDALMEIGLMWVQEARKPLINFKRK
jgi:hypothetical protein